MFFELFLSFTFYFLPFFFFFPVLMTDGDSMTINNLRDSANGTFVTLDDYLPLAGYEPNAMELTNATELNDAVSSDFIDFQDSLDYTAPSSDHYMDDDTLGKLLAEAHRDYADYRRPEGVSVSPSSMSVMVDRTGEPVEKSDSDHFGFGVRNVYSAPNQFPVITQAERMVDRTGKPVEEMIAEERESSSAQIRTLFNEQRKTIIAECCEKVSRHELLAAQAEQERRILQGELLRQQQDFREVHQQVSHPGRLPPPSHPCRTPDLQGVHDCYASHDDAAALSQALYNKLRRQVLCPERGWQKSADEALFCQGARRFWTEHPNETVLRAWELLWDLVRHSESTWDVGPAALRSTSGLRRLLCTRFRASARVHCARVLARRISLQSLSSWQTSTSSWRPRGTRVRRGSIRRRGFSSSKTVKDHYPPVRKLRGRVKWTSRLCWRGYRLFQDITSLL